MGKPKQLWSEVFDDYFSKDPGHPPDWETMSPRERLAVSLGVLSSQVKRNGFMFWIINGFAATHTDEILNQLDALATETASRVRVLVVEVADLAKRAEVLEERADDGDESAGQELDNIAGRCEELDGLFTEIGDELMEEVDVCLSTLHP